MLLQYFRIKLTGFSFFFILFSLNDPAVTKGQSQERQIIIYNVTFGALTGGIGAALNKPANVNWKTAFAKGFWQGSIGGLLTYTGKKSLYFINKNKTLEYAWPAKIIHAAGASIIENAAANEKFLQNWNINIGPARFDLTFGAEHKIKARFLPFVVYSVIAGSVYGDLDIMTSVQTGNIAFKNESAFYAFGGYNSGLSLGRAIVYENSYDRLHIISHELVHQFEFDEYQATNSFLKPLECKVSSHTLKTLFSGFIYFDVPSYLIGYGIEGNHPFPYYYRNYYEFEAERLSTNAYVPR